MSVETPKGGDLDEWCKQHEANRSRNEELSGEIIFALNQALAEARIKVHSVTSRVKATSSFREKIERKGYDAPLTDMHDIVAARVVCLFLDDISKVDQVIRRTFSVEDYKEKGKDSSPDTWRYISVHYDCKLSPRNSGPRYDGLKDRIFEIQVRTILQDAWASVEHYLAYKGANSVPDSLRRDFSALAGLFHVADRSFQQLYNDSQDTDQSARTKLARIASDKSASAKSIAESDLAIDRSTLKALLRQMFPDRTATTDTGYSMLVENLADVDIRSIGELRTALKEGLPGALMLEKKIPPDKLNPNQPAKFTDGGLVRNALDLAVPGFRELRLKRVKAQLRHRARLEANRQTD